MIYFLVALTSKVFNEGLQDTFPLLAGGSYFIYILLIFILAVQIIKDILAFFLYNTRDPSSKLAWANNNPKIDVERYIMRIILVSVYYWDNQVIYIYIYIA